MLLSIGFFVCLFLVINVYRDEKQLTGFKNKL